MFIFWQSCSPRLILPCVCRDGCMVWQPFVVLSLFLTLSLYVYKCVYVECGLNSDYPSQGWNCVAHRMYRNLVMYCQCLVSVVQETLKTYDVHSVWAVYQRANYSHCLKFFVPTLIKYICAKSCIAFFIM